MTAAAGGGGGGQGVMGSLALMLWRLACFVTPPPTLISINEFLDSADYVQKYWPPNTPNMTLLIVARWLRKGAQRRTSCTDTEYRD